MPPLRAMIDTNIVHALSADPDTLAMVTKLQANGTLQLQITHLQGDQLSKAPPHIRKTAKTLDLTTINTDGLVWDVSQIAGLELRRLRRSCGDTVRELVGAGEAWRGQ
jgi:hypothetical protein